MVAPVPRTKWRQHCSTCGKQFDAPQTWAYCSKKCESERQGLAAMEAREDSIDEWLHPIHIERLDLRRQLETAMPFERAGLWAKILANESREAEMRDSLSNAPVPIADPKLTKPLLTRDSPAFWLPILRRESDRFELTLRRSLAAAIVLGRRLLEAKANLPHGEFGRLFRERQDAVEGALQFSGSWARKLMTIGANEVIANRSHANDLPPDIETVYLLSQLPAPDLEAAIASGAVAPDMRRADARDLLPASEAAEPSEPVDEVARALEPIGRHLRRFAAEHSSLFGELKSRLKAALRAIENELAEVAGNALRTAPERGDMGP